MDTQHEVLNILHHVLGPNGKSGTLAPGSPLLGAIPELDSIAVTAVLTAFEDRFGITIEDDELDASSFATVSSLVNFVQTKLAQARIA